MNTFEITLENLNKPSPEGLNVFFLSFYAGGFTTSVNKYTLKPTQEGLNVLLFSPDKVFAQSE